MAFYGIAGLFSSFYFGSIIFWDIGGGFSILINNILLAVSEHFTYNEIIRSVRGSSSHQIGRGISFKKKWCINSLPPSKCWKSEGG